MPLCVTKACPVELVGRRVRRILWDDVTGMARRPPAKRRGPDDRIMRWRAL